MNNGEICEGDGHVTGYGSSNDLDNCGDYDIFTCVEDTEGNVLEFSKLLCPIDIICPVGRLRIYFHFSAYDECQNDDGCRDGGIQGLCRTDQMQKCNHHCLQTKRNYRNKGYNANKLEYFLNKLSYGILST